MASLTDETPEGRSIVVLAKQKYGLRAEELAQLLSRILKQCCEDLDHGAIVSVTERNIRLRRLPLLKVPQPPSFP